MTIRLISTAALALVMLSPLAMAKPVTSQPPEIAGCLQRDIGQKADCIDPTAAQPSTLGGVTADTQDLANGNGGFVPKQGKYTIIYQANPFLTIDNNPK